MKENIYSLKNFTYQIPKELIAQQPVTPRDTSRLLVVNRKKGLLKEVVFRDIINFLEKGDVLVLNDTKVIKARLWGRKESGGKLEFLLLREVEKGLWEVLVKPAKRAKPGCRVIFNKEGNFYAKIMGKTSWGTILLQFFPSDITAPLKIYGKIPLPPYIKKELEKEDSYQTVFARKEGAIAAPTAGLHFTQDLLDKIKKKGVEIVYITLHCGGATFRPVKTSDIRQHKLDEEVLEVSSRTGKIINQAKQRGAKIFAVGTTTIRALESTAVLTEKKFYRVVPQTKVTSLYIWPGYHFKIPDAIVTNFHTPCSTNLILIASFCGLELLWASYQYAIANRFRFFSFGDAMLII